MFFFNANVQSALPGSNLIRSFGIGRFCSPARKLRLVLAALLVAMPLSCPAAALELTADQQLSTAGYFQLSWAGGKKSGEVYVLEEAGEDSKNASVIYQGTDTATVLSGKPNGVYHYTVTTLEGDATSMPVTITVAHHSLETAFNFFLTGAIVFIFIMVAILRGNREQAHCQ